MFGRDEPRGTTLDPDDWFAGSGLGSLDEAHEHTSGNARGDEPAAPAVREPAWLEDAVKAEEPLPRASRLAGASRRRLAAIAAGAIVLILVVLAASGVFSGGGSTSSSALTTTSQVTTRAPAPTAPASARPVTSTPAATLPTGVLKPEARGTDVKTIQRALASVGHSPGPIDGVYGPRTEQAISAFQRSAGITVDGIYGPETKKALEEDLNSG